MTMKLIFAKALDENRSAVMFDMGNGKIVGGVAMITRLENEYGDVPLLSAARYENIKSSKLDLVWQWSKSINASQFEEFLIDTLDGTLTNTIDPKIIEHK